MTCSIIARDTKTWEIWGWAFTKAFDCSNCLVAKAGVGIVATQGLTNFSYGPKWRDYLSSGLHPKEVIDKLVSEDSSSGIRQLAVLDNGWNYSQFSWSECMKSVCEYRWDNFCVQWNLMTNDKVAEAVGEAFEKHEDLPLAERIIVSLMAWQEMWGDLRGIQSAAIVVVPWEEQEEWGNYSVQISVQDNTAPLVELERLLKVQRGYAVWWKWFEYFNEGNVEKWIEYFSKAEEFLWKGYDDLLFWKAQALSKVWHKEESEKVIKWLWDNWWELYLRLK